MKTRTAEIMLALALALRGTSLLFSKLALADMGPFMLLGYRFTVAFVFLAIVFNKQIRGATQKEIFHSALLGIAYTLSAVLELSGLETTASSTAGFLENAVLIFVMIGSAIIYRTLPDRISVVSAVIAIVGLMLLTAKGVHLNFTRGEFLILASTVTFAGVIILTDMFSKTDSPHVLSVFQLLFIGIFSIICAFIFDVPHIPSAPSAIVAILWLGIICSGISFTMQLFAQKYTSADRTGLFTALNPIVAAVLGVAVLHETFSLIGIIGSILVLIAVMLPSIYNIIKE